MIGLDFTTPVPVPNAFPSGIESEAFAEAVRQLAETGRQLWRELFLDIDTEDQLSDWELRIPRYGCDCKSFYLDWKSTNPPTFPLRPRWKYELKTAVNKKLNRPNLTWQESCKIWGWDVTEKAPMCPCQINPPVKMTRDVAIVTALSPNRITRQLICVKSWLDSGYHVIANQTSKEMETFPQLFAAISDRIEWRINNDVESFYNFKTQKIRNLLSFENAILVNSDCEMAGENNWKPGDVTTFFLRWNYKPGDEPREFEWGIDGAWLTREAWLALPEDFPYCIGQAMWDYAIPHILKIKGIPFRIEHKPWLFHEIHKQNWSQAYWQRGADWLDERFYSALRYSDVFRQSLDPDWYYDYNRGFWVKREVDK